MEEVPPSLRIQLSKPHQGLGGSIVLELDSRSTLSCRSGLPTTSSNFSYLSTVLLCLRGGGTSGTSIVVLVLVTAKDCGVQIKDGCANPFRTGTDPVLDLVLRDNTVFPVFSTVSSLFLVGD